MTFWQKESIGLAGIFTLILATLVFGGMFMDVGARVYLSTGAAWCVIAAILLAVRATLLHRRLHRMHDCLCHHCGYEFVHDREQVCPDCGAERQPHHTPQHVEHKTR